MILTIIALLSLLLQALGIQPLDKLVLFQESCRQY
jgi:hypothetical protein